MKKKILIGIITLLIIIIAVAIGLYVGNSTVRLWTDKYILKKDIGEEDLPTNRRKG
jgi:flagellar biosynthesis/type III secretory pathway M-ring protein FliF/YscJ